MKVKQFVPECMYRTPDTLTNVHMYINTFTTEYMPIHISFVGNHIDCHIDTLIGTKY